ncbi:MAG: glycosyl hydrolase [Oligoflexus sp.]
MSSLKKWISILLITCGSSACNQSIETSEIRNSATEIRVEVKRNQLLAGLKSIAASGKFIFGQQKANLAGIGEDGNAAWGAESYGNTSDVKLYFGDEPGVLGLDVWDLATKNPTWNQSAYVQSIQDFYDNGNGGVINLEWHMRGCDTNFVTDANGISGIPGEGFYLNDWDNDSQRSCLCRIVNEEPWKDGKSWFDWLKEERLQVFVDKLKNESLDQIPMVFRPFHEHTGSWFWWGRNSWDCEKHLGRDDVLAGEDAYKKLVRDTVNYLRKDAGLENFLIAYSPDKLCQSSGHKCDPTRTSNNELTFDDYLNDYLASYPGDEYVDILGIDLYYAADNGRPWEKFDYQTALFRQYLQVVTKLARDKGKVAALTETGNYNLHREVNESSNWFSNHLLSLLSDPEISMAYVLTWENRRVAETEYYIPHKEHAGFQDFLDFANDASSLFLSEISGIYSDNFGLSAKQEPASDETPNCASPESDDDGDGWGWENSKSCRVVGSLPEVPECQNADSDPDGDGWGWENSKSCRVVSSLPKVLECQNADSDPDGDGWGWENNQSCQVRS